MNIPRNEQRKENLIQDLSNKEIFLERKQENLLKEIEKIEEKIISLKKTKEIFKDRLEEIKILQSKNKETQSILREVKIPQPTQDTREEKLAKLYRDNPSLAGLSETKIPRSVIAEYDL